MSSNLDLPIYPAKILQLAIFRSLSDIIASPIAAEIVSINFYVNESVFVVFWIRVAFC